MRTICANSRKNASFGETVGRALRAAVLTAGCRLNQSESDALCRTLSRQGVTLLDDPSTADVCFVNTCTVTASADRSSTQLIRRVSRLKPKPRLVVLGCLAERAPDRVRALPGVDEVWTNEYKQQVIAGHCPVPTRSRAFLKVQDGCSRRCSYCVVSRLRGAPRSVPAATVASHVEQLLAEGFFEFVLTGLNLGTYSAPDGTDLAGLLRTLLSIRPEFRIRLGSIEPDTIGDELLEVFLSPRICPHVHLPLQSADDSVLKAMRRNYTAGDFSRLVSQLRSVRPDVCIGADVIVGFPTEDSTAFGRTRDLVKELELAYLHVFSFSARPETDTPSTRPGKTTDALRGRVHEMRQLGAELRRRYEKRFVGTVRQAVVETRRTALTDNYLRLHLAGSVAVPPGRPTELQIVSSDSGLAGVPVIQTEEET